MALGRPANRKPATDEFNLGFVLHPFVKPLRVGAGGDNQRRSLWSDFQFQCGGAALVHQGVRSSRQPGYRPPMAETSSSVMDPLTPVSQQPRLLQAMSALAALYATKLMIPTLTTSAAATVRIFPELEHGHLLDMMHACAFFVLSQSGEAAEEVGSILALRQTTPSSPSVQACRKTVAPSSCPMCSLKRMAGTLQRIAAQRWSHARVRRFSDAVATSRADRRSPTAGPAAQHQRWGRGLHLCRKQLGVASL